jgi:NAD(P)-dependent dehydrogenase (short-subunit alcohol dehydrogenase family)
VSDTNSARQGGLDHHWSSNLSYTQILSVYQIGLMNLWTAADVPDQSGRTAVVTGATAGLGLETAKALAERGASVVLACRDLDKAERAATRIQADVQIVKLDLASLASVHAVAGEIRAAHSRLDLLILNAGVMDVPYERTEDGFELMLATNHLGHFALTGLLLDRLLATAGSRIVTVSSVAHRRGRIRFDDLQSERSYNASDAYAQSKLANLLFSYELDRRLRDAAACTISLAAHPGNARTELWRSSSRLERAVISTRLRFLNSWLVQSAEAGALPTLRAATDPSARGGEYFGPSGRFEFAGHPVRVGSNERSHDATAQQQLWEVSEQLTGISYELQGRE